MKGVLVGAGAPQGGASMIDRRAEDRWVGRPVRRASSAMSAIVLASLAIHAGLILAAMLFTPADPVSRKEISVELVREPAPPKAEAGKASEVKGEPAKAEPAKPEPVKPEVKAEEPKPEPPEPEPPKAEVQAPKPAERPPEPDPADKKALDTLKQELESLKAEQAALKDQQAQAAAQPGTREPATDPAGPMIADGRMPPSFGAVALPALSEVDGEVTGYQQIVFGQLAKAKGIRRHMGLPGTAGVVFRIDGDGKLVEVRIAQASGSDALDAEALDVVKAAQPFPRPPPGAQRSFSANFNFVPQAAP